MFQLHVWEPDHSRRSPTVGSLPEMPTAGARLLPRSSPGRGTGVPPRRLRCVSVTRGPDQSRRNGGSQQANQGHRQHPIHQRGRWVQVPHVGDRHPDPNTTGCTGPGKEAVAVFWGADGHLWGTCLGAAAHCCSVGSAAGLQVRSLARGQHRGVVLLRKCPLVAPPIGPPTVPLADVAIQNVLDVLHNQVDGNCDSQNERVSRMNGSAH